MKKIRNLINKQYILENIDQVKIFAKYLQISEDDIRECIKYKVLISSPIRHDPHASVGFRYSSKGILKMRDFGGFFWGDCFDIVAYVLNKNKYKLKVNHKNDFKYILRHIAIEFDILDGVKADNIITLVDNAKTSKKQIAFTIRHWNSSDKKLWITNYHNILSFIDLNKGFIYPVENYWVDPDSQPAPKYYYKANDPCYAYYMGQDSDDIANIRLYFPLRKEFNPIRPKFISNNFAMQGLLNITGKYDRVVITKSYKDALLLDKLLALIPTGLRILVIAYPSENYPLRDDVVAYLISILNEPEYYNILHFLDFDYTGRKTSRIAYEKYGIPYAFLTNGMFGTVNYGAKDISDFLELFKIELTLKVIKLFIIHHEPEQEQIHNDYGEHNEANYPF